jgi:valyl-tRNA synthetase
MGNLSDLKIVEQEVSGALSFRVQTSAFYIPLGNAVNAEEEIVKIVEELKYTEGFLESVMKKMSNERFVKNAPTQVVELEKKKQADAEEKIRLLKERLESLKQ